MRFIMLATLCFLVGCGIRDQSLDYRGVTMAPMLKVPAGLSVPNRDEHFFIPMEAFDTETENLLPPGM